jgi:hypothetical protein
MPPPMAPPTSPLPPTPAPRFALLVAAIWLVSALPVVLGISSCPIARVFHTPCPGCGMTRAVELLLHGDARASLAMHPLAVPTALTQLAFAIVTVLVTLRHGTPFVLWKTRMGRWSVYAVAFVVACDLFLWIARALGFMHGPVPV